MNRKKSNQTPRVKTLDERLADKFDWLQMAREEHNSTLFDEFTQSIAILLKGSPRAYQEFIALKQEMDRDLQEHYQRIQAKINEAPDAITRDEMGRRFIGRAEWDYRITLEESIMEILEKYSLIPLSEKGPSAIRLSTDEEVEEEQQQPKPEPKKKKPHLLKTTEKKFSV